MDEIYYGKEELISVIEVLACENFTLELYFSNGQRGIFDATNILQKPVFKPLNSKVFFLTAKAMYGTVVWNDDIDLAPEFLYENSVLLN